AAKLALSAGGWISQLLGHDTAIDQHDVALSGRERRDDMPPRPALGHGVEIKLLGVVEAALELDPVIARILSLANERGRLAEADGRALGARLDLGDQPFLPMQALQLPDAKPDQQS